MPTDPHCTPALLTGTSTEFLGKRHLPRVIRERHAVFVMGPDGSGKTSVARRFAGEGALYLHTAAVQRALTASCRYGRWSSRLLRARSLVLDGPTWLHARPGPARLLADLIQRRVDAGRTTVICQADHEASSLEPLTCAMAVGSIVVVGLRFPKGRRGRQRFARRMCDEMGLCRSAARGTDLIAPWCYDAVLRRLVEQGADAASQSPAPPAPRAIGLGPRPHAAAVTAGTPPAL